MKQIKIHQIPIGNHFFFLDETRDKSKEDSAKTSLKDEKEKREKYKSEKVFSSLDSLPGQKYIT